MVNWRSDKKSARPELQIKLLFRGVPNIFKVQGIFEHFHFLLCGLLSSICDILYVCFGDLGDTPNNIFH